MRDAIRKAVMIVGTFFFSLRHEPKISRFELCNSKNHKYEKKKVPTIITAFRIASLISRLSLSKIVSVFRRVGGPSKSSKRTFSFIAFLTDF
jgi:hypothetical protein